MRSWIRFIPLGLVFCLSFSIPSQASKGPIRFAPSPTDISLCEAPLSLDPLGSFQRPDHFQIFHTSQMSGKEGVARVVAWDTPQLQEIRIFLGNAPIRANQGTRLLYENSNPVHPSSYSGAQFLGQKAVILYGPKKIDFFSISDGTFLGSLSTFRTELSEAQSSGRKKIKINQTVERVKDPSAEIRGVHVILDSYLLPVGVLTLSIKDNKTVFNLWRVSELDKKLDDLLSFLALNGEPSLQDSGSFFLEGLLPVENIRTFGFQVKESVFSRDGSHLAILTTDGKIVFFLKKEDRLVSLPMSTLNARKYFPHGNLHLIPDGDQGFFLSSMGDAIKIKLTGSPGKERQWTFEVQKIPESPSVPIQWIR